MRFTSLFLYSRIIIPMAASGLAFAFWRYVSNQNGDEKRQNALLIVTYGASRLGVWLLFAIYLQDYVTTSDPRLFYTPQLEHFLGGDIPIRDFYYPYAPFLLPSMLPFYLLLGHSLAGISLFAIFAEGAALFFLLKSASLLEQRGEIALPWVREALAVYLLNPATLYWTVFQGYHSIVQTAYAMAALYFLLLGYYKTGYALGLFSLAGAKLLAILDWPGLLAVCRPRITSLILGAVPVLITYAIYQVITGDIFFPLRYHIGYTGEGNVWYFTTLFVDLYSFYSRFPGNLLPIFFFAIPFLLGLVLWIRCLRLGLTSFSFQAAMGTTTFTMSLFFLFSLYTGSYYIPMFMLPASLVVTCPAVPHRQGILLLLLISGFCITGDAIWASFGQPNALVNAFSSGSSNERLLTSLWILSILVRMACFAKLGVMGLWVARTHPLNRQTIASSLESANLRNDNMRIVQRYMGDQLP
jgi:hypothetical protein